MKKNEKIITYLYIVVLYLFVFQNILQKSISILKYFDEIIALSLIPVIIIYIIRNKDRLRIKKYDFVIVFFLILLCIVGLYSNVIYKYQPISIALSDVLLIYKFFMTYFVSIIIFKDKQMDDKLILKNVKFLIIIMFFGTIYDYILNKNLVVDIRFGIKSNKFIYEHPTYLAATSVYLLSNLIRFEKKNKLTPFVYMILLVLFSTLRMKAIAFGIIFILIAIYVEKSNKRLRVSKMMILGIIALIIAFDQIQYYFITIDDSARASLFRTSIQIAKDYFPIGTGFATFASFFSGIHYSPIYAIYGINNVYGLQEGKTFFLYDSFWPMILGEFGVLGMVLYCSCIVLIYMKIQREFKKENKWQYISRMLCLIYLIISSTSETAFVNSFSVPLAIMMAI